MRISIVCSSLILIVSLLFLTQYSRAGDYDKVLREADILIMNKKYNKAYKHLDDVDKDNAVPEIVLKKVELALDYFVLSIMHTIFSFKDLEADENIEDVRGKEGQDTFVFDIEQVLSNLIKIRPNNWKLHKALGYYYYEVYLKYGSGWTKDVNTLLDNAEKHYLQAKRHGEYDYKSLHALGVIHLRRKKYEEAVSFLLDSIKLNSNYAPSKYNLAYAYLYLNKRKNALKYAKEAMMEYRVAPLKAEAARMVAVIYKELKDDKNALIYFKKANAIQPNVYVTLKPMLALYLKKRDTKTAYKIATALFLLNPKNPALSNDILRAYAQYNEKKELIRFFDNMLKRFSGDDEVMGNLYFHKAKFFLQEGNTDGAKNSLKTAKEHFKKCFANDHKVLNTIDAELRRLGG